MRTCVLEDTSDFVDGDTTSIISHSLARLTCKYQEHVTGEKSSVVNLVIPPIAVAAWQIPKGGLVCLPIVYLICYDNFSCSTIHVCNMKYI